MISNPIPVRFIKIFNYFKFQSLDGSYMVWVLVHFIPEWMCGSVNKMTSYSYIFMTERQMSFCETKQATLIYLVQLGIN